MASRLECRSSDGGMGFFYYYSSVGAMMVNQVGGGLGMGIKSGRWEGLVLGGARWAAWACRSRLGLAASLPARCYFCNPMFLLKLIIWCFCCKKFLCNFCILADVSFFYWVAKNSCFLPWPNRSYTPLQIVVNITCTLSCDHRIPVTTKSHTLQPSIGTSNPLNILLISFTFSSKNNCPTS